MFWSVLRDDHDSLRAGGERARAMRFEMTLQEVLRVGLVPQTDDIAATSDDSPAMDRTAEVNRGRVIALPTPLGEDSYLNLFV